MRSISAKNIQKFDLESLPVDPSWNADKVTELKIHKIHLYPARFPAFMTRMALEYAKTQGLTVKLLADIFCGCGTTAFEAKRNGVEFWGCDINPVATLIARVKSQKYQSYYLNKHLNAVLKYCQQPPRKQYGKASERLQYWHAEEQYDRLAQLKVAILQTISKRSRYQDFFLCAFSNILKPSSRWLTKSIKPQVDPEKPSVNVIDIFTSQ